jgi:hypothetical protein
MAMSRFGNGRGGGAAMLAAHADGLATGRTSGCLPSCGARIAPIDQVHNRRHHGQFMHLIVAGSHVETRSDALPAGTKLARSPDRLSGADQVINRRSGEEVAG